MNNEELKKFESVAFIMLEVLAKAVEMKKLQLDEKKLDIDREMWIEKRSGQKVGSEVPKQKFPSGGITSAENWTGKIVGAGFLSDEKEFVIPKSLFPIQSDDKSVSEKYPKHKEGGMIYHGSDFNKSKEVDSIETFSSIASQIEEGIRAGTIVPIKFENGILDCLGKLPKDIHEEALENGLKTEKKCETASEFLKEKESFEFPKRNFDYLDNEDYFAVREGLVNVFLESNDKQLFFFNDRDSKKIILIKNYEQADFAKRNKKEIYFKWVRR